jgi:hypothetical protein
MIYPAKQQGTRGGLTDGFARVFFIVERNLGNDPDNSRQTPSMVLKAA